MLVSITYVLVNITCDGECGMCVGEYNICVVD